MQFEFPLVNQQVLKNEDKSWIIKEPTVFTQDQVEKIGEIDGISFTILPMDNQMLHIKTLGQLVSL